ncbi:LPS export ABC transporter permease LptF [Allorhizobium taibaishanense]|uniref:LPS export ABC transporter permease LptF n=1 Tax=Allorhizobium taibaishanense TaxID=887144 RepID=A0A1Q8ZZ72_9HYPH|nr:LPS export ABC transporter permease LptF [Allorhizobium taibaishanense]MBB4007472.1 lipopolysaccharide export system permease protein [Allorhizobium taibaishanense]OLP47577.1 LPS export ABC transporter permease LptF [Allorhizobium taibaishanense]
MKLLETYILRRVAQMFLTALLPVLAIIWTTQVLARINLVTDTGQSIGSFATLATLILPTIIPIVMPFALVIGITQSLTAMNNDSELAVIDAAGAPRSVILRPILLFALGISLITLVITNEVQPKVKVAARQMIANAYADLLSTVIEEKTFRKVEDGLYVQISQRLAGRVLKGLFVADYRDPAYSLIYYAREGAVDETGTALIMHDGEVQRKAPGGTVSIVRFDSYAFDLSDLTETRGKAKMRPSDRSLGFLLNPDPNDDDYKDHPGDYRAELHKRMTEWLLPFAFALISLAIAGDARSHREARLHPMVSALTLALVLRWLTFYASNKAESNGFFIVLMYATPIASGAIATLMLIRQKKSQLPAPIRRVVDVVRSTFQKRFVSSGQDNGGGA